MGNSTLGGGFQLSAYVSVGRASGMLGCSAQTIRNYLENGVLVGRLRPSGHRQIELASIRKLLNPNGEQNQQITRKIICYSRVSGKGQNLLNKRNESDLTRQRERIRKFAQEKYRNCEIVEFSEQTSAMNPDRKAFSEMIRGICAGNYSNGVLIVSHIDRLSRSYASLMYIICSCFNIEIVCCESDDEKDIERLVFEDLMNQLFIFQIKKFSARSAERKRKIPETEAIQLGKKFANEGHSILKCVDLLRENGHILSTWQFRKYIYELEDYAEVIAPKMQTSAKEYVEANIETASDQTRLFYDVVYKDYLEWCQANKKPELSRRKFLQEIKAPWVSMHKNHVPEGHSQSAFRGIRVKGKALHVTVRKLKRSTELPTQFDGFFNFYGQIKGKKLPQAQIFSKYSKYCKENGLIPLSKNGVITALQQMGSVRLLEEKQLSWSVA